MGNPLPRCEDCGRTYRPNPYNADRQKYCTREKCKVERRRKRQRERERRKCASDEPYREERNRRCAQANRRRRARPPHPPPQAACGEPSCELSPQAICETVCGMIIQLTDISDAEQLRLSVQSFRDRGRRVTAAVPAEPG